MSPRLRNSLAHIGLSHNMRLINRIRKIISMWGRETTSLIDCTLLNYYRLSTSPCGLDNYTIRDPYCILLAILLKLRIFLRKTMRLVKNFLKIFRNRWFNYLLFDNFHNISHKVGLLFLISAFIVRWCHDLKWRSLSFRMILPKILVEPYFDEPLTVYSYQSICNLKLSHLRITITETSQRLAKDIQELLESE